MTMQERDTLRAIQDQVISKLESRGITGDDTVERHDYYGIITVNDLRTTLYPKMADRFADFLRTR